jgi:hypothetical protein
MNRKQIYRYNIRKLLHICFTNSYENVKNLINKGFVHINNCK